MEQFLSKFTIISEQSENDHIDIILILKAIPYKIDPINIKRIDLFQFRVFQESLIAYQNLFIVNAFEYVDDKNRDRALGIKEKLSYHKKQVGEIENNLDGLLNKLEGNQDLLQKITQKAFGGGVSKEDLLKTAEQAVIKEQGRRATNLVIALQRLASRAEDPSKEQKREEIKDSVASEEEDEAESKSSARGVDDAKKQLVESRHKLFLSNL